MIVGAYGPVVFSVSSDVVRTFRNGTRSRESVFARHAVIGRAPRIEPLNDELDTASIEIRLDQDLGTSPALELEAINELKKLQRAWPLILGPVPMGEYVIVKISEEWRRFTRLGALASVSVTLDLLEDADGPLTTRLTNG